MSLIVLALAPPALPLAAQEAPATCPEAEPDRQLALALELTGGNAREKNETTARACLAAAAAAGNARAQLELAIFMLKGIGGDKDEAGAKNWLQRAADGGSDAARQMREELERQAAAQTASAPAAAQTPHGNRLVAFIVGGAFILGWIWVVSGRPVPSRRRHRDRP